MGMALDENGTWVYPEALYGIPGIAWAAYERHCCIPFGERTCIPDPTEQWTQQSRQDSRDGASMNPLGDANCDLTVNWEYETPVNTVPYMGGIVSGERVFLATNSNSGSASAIDVLDLNSVGPIATVLETIGPDTVMGDFVFRDPTIANGVLYQAGGSNRKMNAWDVSVSPATLLWSVREGGASGPTSWAAPLVIDGYVYYGTTLGQLHARDALTGAQHPGWAVYPRPLPGGAACMGVASDGTSLYAVTYTAGVMGDVYKINPATGVVMNTLSGGDGLQGYGNIYSDTLWDPASSYREGFTNITVVGGVAYCNARLAGDHPVDGAFYRLNSGDLGLLSAVASQGFLYSNPIVDQDRVIVPTLSGWVLPTFVTGIHSFSKNSGGIAFNFEEYSRDTEIGRYWGNAVLTCEPDGVPDQVLSVDEQGIFHVYNADDGTETFRRRFDFGDGVSDGAGVTYSAHPTTGEQHVIVTATFGYAVDMTKRDDGDRPRLEIATYRASKSADFPGPLTSMDWYYEDLFVNTGCAPLTFTTLGITDTANGSTDPGYVRSVRPEILDGASSIAADLASNASYFKGNKSASSVAPAADEFVSVRDISARTERINSAATANPIWLNAMVEPYVGQQLAGGDTLDLWLDVDQTALIRGPQSFYLEVGTDDPDFWLNQNSSRAPVDPSILVTLIGGCLLDTTYLHFGVGAGNTRIVSNSLTLSEGDWDPHSADIDGADAAEFQGCFLFGVTQHRIAMNVSTWVSGEQLTRRWLSAVPDPNYCSFGCKPALSSGVGLGAYWSGGGYVGITGDVICKSFIDSVQNFDTAGYWNWNNIENAVYDNDSTMGLRADARVIGTVDVPELHGVTIEIFDFEMRDGGDLPDWKFGYLMDYDVGGDTAIMFREISTGVSTRANFTGNDAWGITKIPFGCGYEPIKNIFALDAGQGQFEQTEGHGNPYWDSAYYYMSLPIGEYGHNMGSARDQEFHATLIEHDFTGGEHLQFGAAMWGLNNFLDSAGAANEGAADIETYRPMANFINQWAGFGRGDVNNDGAINLTDIIMLGAIINGVVPGAIPFEHLADVNAISDPGSGVTAADLAYMINFYFFCGPCPEGAWEI
jgi:hypothetical protein